MPTLLTWAGRMKAFPPGVSAVLFEL
jgi:hypothetical protein